MTCALHMYLMSSLSACPICHPLIGQWLNAATNVPLQLLFFIFPYLPYTHTQTHSRPFGCNAFFCSSLLPVFYRRTAINFYKWDYFKGPTPTLRGTVHIEETNCNLFFHAFVIVLLATAEQS